MAFPSPAGTTNGRAVYVDIPEGIKPIGVHRHVPQEGHGTDDHCLRSHTEVDEGVRQRSQGLVL